VDDLARLVGERLRAARQRRGLSLGALAEAAHVGKGSLSEIENGVRNPTLGTLYALAGALGVPLATLIADRPGVRVASPGIEARLLDVSHDGAPDPGPGLGAGLGAGPGAGLGAGGGQTVEVYRLRLEPGRFHRSPAHGPGVVEHLLVTSGRARVGRLGEEIEIGAGQAARWASDVPHGYAALGADPVESVLVIWSPGPTGPGHAEQAARVGRLSGEAPRSGGEAAVPKRGRRPKARPRYSLGLGGTNNHADIVALHLHHYAQTKFRPFIIAKTFIPYMR
jgi:DNA-binding XRE family transcriptional regulator/quercetin dioxygenase-like cupin family protein